MFRDVLSAQEGMAREIRHGCTNGGGFGRATAESAGVPRLIAVEEVAAIATVNSDTMRACGLGTAGLYDIQRLAIRWDGYVRRIRHPRQALEPRGALCRVRGGPYGRLHCRPFFRALLSQHHKTEGELQSI